MMRLNLESRPLSPPPASGSQTQKSTKITFLRLTEPINFQDQSFNLANQLVKQFRVEKPVKYFMDTTMKRLTGVDATYIPTGKLSPKQVDGNLDVDADLPATDDHPVIDWKKTFLWHNSQKSEEFNHLGAPLILKEE